MSIDLLLDPLLPRVPPLLEVAHVAHRLRFTEDHVRTLLRTGQLPASQFGNRWRVKPADLEAFIDSRRLDRRSPDAPADRRIPLHPHADEAAT
jgi:excisionase family DNA binding protein